MKALLMSIRPPISERLTLALFTLLILVASFGFFQPLLGETIESGVVETSEPDSKATTLNPSYSFDDFKGVWLTEIDGRALYLIIQRNQIARYFYQTGIDNTVYQSRWQLDPNQGLEVLDIASVRIRIDLKSETIHYASTDLSTAEATPAPPLSQSSKIERVNSALLGDWARPPDYESPENQYIPASYFGYWKISSDADGRSFEVQKNRRVIALTLPTNATEESQDERTVLLGEWYKHGQQLHVSWENGTYSIVDNSNPKLVKLYDFRPGEAIKESGSFSILTQSLETADREFWETMRSSIEQKSKISLQHLAKKTLLKFYRGDWVVHDPSGKEPYSFIKFGRFGGVELSSNKRNAGTWYPTSRRCTLNFEDGTRMLFSPVGSGFLIFVYEATRPLDAYPNKVLTTAPLNRDKLTWLKSEPSYSLNLLSQWSEEQFLNGAAHAFGGSHNSTQSTQYSPPINPWWWPIWNDSPNLSSTEAVEDLNPTELFQNNRSASETDEGLSLASKKPESDLESVDQESTAQAEESFTPRANPWRWPY